MKERIEDLGRIAVMLDNVITSEVFDIYSYGRCKDYDMWWESLSDEKKDDALRAFVYGLSDLREKLYEILEVANGDPE